MIWIAIAYLAGFAATLIVLDSQNRERVRTLSWHDGVRPRPSQWIENRRLSYGRLIWAALIWFVTVPLGLYIARRVRSQIATD